MHFQRPSLTAHCAAAYTNPRPAASSRSCLFLMPLLACEATGSPSQSVPSNGQCLCASEIGTLSTTWASAVLERLVGTSQNLINFVKHGRMNAPRLSLTLLAERRHSAQLVRQKRGARHPGPAHAQASPGWNGWPARGRSVGPGMHPLLPPPPRPFMLIG